LGGWATKRLFEIHAPYALRAADPRAKLARWLDRAGVDVFACTYTCLPVFQAVPGAPGRHSRWILNNGAAGMPNFRGDAAGLLTRIAFEPSAQAHRRFGVALEGGVIAEAIATDIDTTAWRARFEAVWPEGIDARVSYLDRIARGPDYAADAAVRTLA
jgi:hypothetical protein